MRSKDFSLPSVFVWKGTRMETKLEISESYLTSTLKSASVKTVGECMSQFETISNLDEIKKAVKNSIYQNFRDLEGQIRAFDCGVRFISCKPLDPK